MAASAGLIAWADPEQEALVRAVCAEAGLALRGVGGPGAGTAAKLAAALDAPPVADLRPAIGAEGADLVWLAAARRPEPEVTRLMRERGVRAISSVPHPASLARAHDEPDEAATAELVPLMRRSPGFLSARDVLEELGRPRCLSVLALGGLGTGGLFARLFDAFDLVELLAGPVESVDGARAAPAGGVPESLLALHGCLTLNLRFADRCCATVTAADAPGLWQRRVTLLGDSACLEIDDEGYRWRSVDGAEDAHREPEPAAPATPARLIARQIGRLLAGLDDREPPARTTRLLALCEAARLSCRTGQGETPARMLEMGRTWSV